MSDVSDGVECPCCGWEGPGFLDTNRPNVQCPECRSKRRHRLLALWLRAETDLLTRPTRLLHVAPEEAVRRIFAASPLLDRVTIDLARTRDIALQADLTRLALRDAAFDAVLCSHVLEHVDDDRAAMRELRRVLAPGGLAIVLIPLYWGRRRTYEDPTITDPAARLAAFGQEDHVRLYGRDVVARLEEAGFAVDPIAYGGGLSPAQRRRFGLSRSVILLACRPS